MPTDFTVCRQRKPKPIRHIPFTEEDSVLVCAYVYCHERYDQTKTKKSLWKEVVCPARVLDRTVDSLKTHYAKLVTCPSKLKIYSEAGQIVTQIVGDLYLSSRPPSDAREYLSHVAQNALENVKEKKRGEYQEGPDEGVLEERLPRQSRRRTRTDVTSSAPVSDDPIPTSADMLFQNGPIWGGWPGDGSHNTTNIDYSSSLEFGMNSLYDSAIEPIDITSSSFRDCLGLGYQFPMLVTADIGGEVVPESQAFPMNFDADPVSLVPYEESASAQTSNTTVNSEPVEIRSELLPEVSPNDMPFATPQSEDDADDDDVYVDCGELLIVDETRRSKTTSPAFSSGNTDRNTTTDSLLTLIDCLSRRRVVTSEDDGGTIIINPKYTIEDLKHRLNNIGDLQLLERLCRKADIDIDNTTNPEPIRIRRKCQQQQQQD